MTAIHSLLVKHYSQAFANTVRFSDYFGLKSRAIQEPIRQLQLWRVPKASLNAPEVMSFREPAQSAANFLPYDLETYFNNSDVNTALIKTYLDGYFQELTTILDDAATDILGKINKLDTLFETFGDTLADYKQSLDDDEAFVQ